MFSICMQEEAKDLIVLGAMNNGSKKFDKIIKVTKIEAEELNHILKKLEVHGFIHVQEKKGLLGKKIELYTTEKGNKELQERIHEYKKNGIA